MILLEFYKRAIETKIMDIIEPISLIRVLEFKSNKIQINLVKNKFINKKKIVA